MNQALSHTLNKEQSKTDLSEKELNEQMLDYLKDATFNNIMESRPENDDFV